MNLNPRFLEALDKKLGFKGSEIAYLIKYFKGLTPFQQALFRFYFELINLEVLMKFMTSFKSKIANSAA